MGQAGGRTEEPGSAERENGGWRSEMPAFETREAEQIQGHPEGVRRRKRGESKIRNEGTGSEPEAELLYQGNKRPTGGGTWTRDTRKEVTFFLAWWSRLRLPSRRMAEGCMSRPSIAHVHF